MKKISLFLSLLCVLFLAGCQNDLDNYDAPNGGIKGRILDAQTNEPIPLPVQGSTGVIINMFEQNTGATKSVDFYARQDGTFENSQLFNCDYRLEVKGPFILTGENLVTVKGQTNFDITATPYARIQASATATGNTVTITYKVTPTSPGYTVTEVYGIWNFAPGVDAGQANLAGKKTVTATEGTLVFDLGSDNVFNTNLYKIKANGNKVYLRVGAKTAGFVNYSQVITVTL